MLELLISYLLCFIEFASIYIIFHYFLQQTFRPSKQDIFVCAAYVLIFGLIPNNDIQILLIAGQLYYIVYIFYLYNKNIFHVLILYSLTVIVLLCTQFSIIFLISMLGIPTDAWYTGIVGSSLSILLICVLFRFKRIRQIYSQTLRASLPVRLFLVNTYLIYLGVLMIFKTNDHVIYTNPTYIFTIVSLIISINVCILYYDRNLQYKEQLLTSYEKNIPIYESLISDIRSRQHEYSNRIQGLRNLSMTCKDYTSLRTALQDYTSEPLHVPQAYPLLQINLPLLAASLYNLTERAANHHIKVQYDIANPKIESQVPEYLLSDFTCILLQNAIEACSENDTIHVHISSENGTLQFEIRNPSDKLFTPQDIKQWFEKGYSTKHKELKTDGLSHGLGLHFLHSQMKKYNGVIGAECITFSDKNWVIFKMII